MLTEKQISALRASFPAEALSADNSRGFELTSIKAAFVVERLNEVFGPCGCGWRYVHSPFEWIEGEVLTEVALQFKVTDGGGVNPVVWDTQAHGWAFVQDGEAWSWPIFSPGGRRPNKGNTPLTDARKGAITDGLTKASSMIGVGHEVFKGLVRPGQANGQPTKATQPAKRPESAPAQPAPSTPKIAPLPVAIQQTGVSGHSVRNGNGNGAATTAVVQVIPAESHTGHHNGNGKVNGTGHPAASSVSGHSVRNGEGNGTTTTAVIQASATTFWMLANKHTDRLDRATVSALAKDVVTGKMSWLKAQSILDDMIQDNSMSTFGSVSTPRETIHQKAGQVVQYAEKVSDPLDELFT